MFTRLRFFLLLAGISLATLAVTGTVVFGQQATSTPAPGEETAGLTFPIPELGGCADMGSCTSYCDDPTHNTQCVAYAQDKGFYEADPLHSATDEFWAKTQSALGCNSEDSCMTVCSDAANHEKCDAFAKAEQLTGGYVTDPQEQATVVAATQALGCTDFATCHDFCNDPANASQCTNFANKVGLLGGTDTEGPGGCTSEGSCTAYCQDPDNFSACAQSAPSGETFHGPGGCDSQTSCRAFCEGNPDQCRDYAFDSNGVYVPVACSSGEFVGPSGACTAEGLTAEAGQCSQAGQFWNGSSCEATPPPGIVAGIGTAHFEEHEDMGGCKTPSECYDYVLSHRDQFPDFDPTKSLRPSEMYHPYVYYTPGTAVKFEPKTEFGNCDSPGSCYDYCAANAGQCQGFDQKSPRPADVYVPGTYYTPGATGVPYFTPPSTSFYVTPVYYTPPEGSTYTTPAYYTPGIYSTPTYYTPSPIFADTRYVSPSSFYYTPGHFGYSTPSESYSTPTYSTPRYFTPPSFYRDYTTPTYYTPPTYTTPNYPTPPAGSNYTTPTYYTPPTYNTPSYYTPHGALLGVSYASPTYYTPYDRSYPTPTYNTPTYYTPGGYYTPSYTTPSGEHQYSTPVYYSPGGNYTTPTYYTPPEGSNYTTPNYPSPTYYSPTYSTPTYHTPPEGSTYTSPSYYTPYGTPSSTSGSYAYPSPSYGSPSYGTPSTSGYATPTGTYAYPTPSSGSYPTPSSSGSYPTPSSSYTYPTPSESYPTPSYSYPSPESYSSPYGTPESYSSPYEYPTPSGEVHGTRMSPNFFIRLLNLFR